MFSGMLRLGALWLASLCVNSYALEQLDRAKNEPQWDCHSTYSKKNSNADQTCTQKSPLSVKVIPAQSGDAHTPNDGNNGDKKPSSERIIELSSIVLTAIATAVMAAFTVLLWCSTHRLWKESRMASRIAYKSARAAKKAAEAAERQAVTMMNAERAHLSFEEFKIVDSRSRTQIMYPLLRSVDEGSVCARYSIKNNGRSPARITSHWGSAQVITGAFRCEDFQRTGQEFESPATFAAGVCEPIGDFDDFSPEQWNSIRTGLANLYVYGRVEYQDIFDMPHAVGFAYLFKVVTNEFEPVCISTHWPNT
jgi:hypothetical protein